MEILLVIGVVGLGALLLKGKSATPSAATQGPSMAVSPAKATTPTALSAPLIPAAAPAASPAPSLTVSPVKIQTSAPVVPPMTAQQAFDEAKSHEYNLDPRDFNNPKWVSDRIADIENMHTMVWFNGQFNYANGWQPQSNDLQLVGTGSGMALAGAGALAGAHVISGIAATAIPFVGIAVSGIIGLFSIIHAHHAAAVKQEQSIYNTANAAAENYFKIIQQAVASRQATPLEAAQAMDSCFEQFKQAAAPSYGHSPYLNAMGESQLTLDAVRIYWKAYYNLKASQGA